MQEWSQVLTTLPAPPTVSKGRGMSLRYMPLIVGQPHRCRRTLGRASHNSTTGPTQIGEFKSSANTGATYDDENSKFSPSFPVRRKEECHGLHDRLHVAGFFFFLMNFGRSTWRRRPNNLRTMELLSPQSL